MDHLEAAALAAAASAATTAINPDIKINSLDSSHISRSFRDDVSLKEYMVRSRSGSSSSVKISTDLQQGLAASIIGQNLRRGSSTVRHRSPHASQERYMPYSATSPRSPHSPLSPQASTSPFLVHSPPPPTSPRSTSNFLSAPPLSSSPSYASYNVLPSGSPSVQLSPAKSPQHLQSTNRHEQQTSQQQQQQEQAAFGRYLHRHNSSEGVPASESWTGRSLSSESSGRSPSSYPLSSHFPPSWSLTSRQESYHDHPNSHLDSKHLHLHRHEPNPRHHHHPASQHHSSTLSDRQEAEHSTRMSQDYPERIGSHREDETSRQHQQRQQQHIRHSPRQRHRHQHQPQHSQHHTHSGRPQDRYQDPRSEHPVDQYFHTSNIPKASTSIHIHHSSPSSAAHNAFAPLSQPLRRSSRHLHSHGQEHHPQQQQHLYTSHPSRHHSMTSEHAEHTSVSSHANTGEPSSSSRGPPYAVSRTSSSSRLPPHSSFSIVSSASVSGSNSVHASLSTFAAGAGSAARPVPAGSTTSAVAMTTTASGEIKTTRRRRRPNESYSTIIIKAIRSSPLQRLKLSEIYDYVSREIPTMDGNDKGWQNTVRHNLSHNKCFRRIVVKDEDLPSGSADDDDGDAKPSNGGKSKQAKRGKGGCWVLVPENLEEHMSSSRPKKSSTDQVQSPGVPGAGSGGLTSSTSPKSHAHHTIGSSGGAIIPKATTSSTGEAYLSAQLSKDCAPSHPHSTVMDIDCNVASMMIAEQQLQQSGRHHGPHMHPSHYTPPHPNSRQNSQCSSQSSHRHPHHQQQHHDASYPYLPPHYPSSSPSSSTMMMNQPRSSSATYQSFTATTRPSQHNYNSSGDEWDHDSESDDGQSEHSVLSADHENDNDDEYEGDEAMDAKGEDDTVSHYSSSRPSPSRSPSASSLPVTSSPMEIEEADGGNGGVSFSSLPTTGRRRPGMSIQNMLN